MQLTTKRSDRSVFSDIQQASSGKIKSSHNITPSLGAFAHGKCPTHPSRPHFPGPFPESRPLSFTDLLRDPRKENSPDRWPPLYRYCLGSRESPSYLSWVLSCDGPSFAQLPLFPVANASYLVSPQPWYAWYFYVQGVCWHWWLV